VYSPRYSFDTTIEQDLQEWERIAEYGLCLVHAVSLHSFRNGDLSRRRAQDVLKTWDVISASLIARRRLWTQSRIRSRNPVETSMLEKNIAMYSSVGLILDVPAENILGTYPKDVFFPTHAPAENYQFADLILHGYSEDNYLFAERYNRIQPPLEIFRNTRKFHSVSDYNEILVVTRPQAKIHFAMTKEVGVTGIIYFPSNRGACRVDDETLLEALQQLNPELQIERA